MAQGAESSVAMFQQMLGHAGILPLDIADPNDPRNLDPSRRPGGAGQPVGGPLGNTGHHANPWAPPANTLPGSAPHYLHSSATDTLRRSLLDVRDANDYIRRARRDQLIFNPDETISLRYGPHWGKVIPYGDKISGITPDVYNALQALEVSNETRRVAKKRKP